MKYTWNLQFETAVSENGLENVIKAIHWRLKATNENGIEAETYGMESLDEPNPKTFIPFADLTTTKMETLLETIFSKPIPIAGTEPIEYETFTKLSMLKNSLVDEILEKSKPKNVILTLNK